MSTLVWSFAFIGAVILVVSLVMRPYFLDWIHVSPGNRAEFRQIFLIFFGALALGFPTGLFNEMLAGAQRLDLINRNLIVGNLINLCMVVTGVHYRWPMEFIVDWTLQYRNDAEMVAWADGLHAARTWTETERTGRVRMLFVRKG